MDGHRIFDQSVVIGMNVSVTGYATGEHCVIHINSECLMFPVMYFLH